MTLIKKPRMWKKDALCQASRRAVIHWYSIWALFRSKIFGVFGVVWFFITVVVVKILGVVIYFICTVVTRFITIRVTISGILAMCILDSCFHCQCWVKGLCGYLVFLAWFDSLIILVLVFVWYHYDKLFASCVLYMLISPVNPEYRYIKDLVISLDVETVSCFNMSMQLRSSLCPSRDSWSETSLSIFHY